MAENNIVELKPPDLPHAKSDRVHTVWECVLTEGTVLTTIDHRTVRLACPIVIDVLDDWLASVE